MIELLTVLVLVGVVLGWGVPSFRGMVDRMQTRGALDRVAQDLSQARLLAGAQGRRVALTLRREGAYSIDTLNAEGRWVPLRSVRLAEEYGGVHIARDLMFEFTSRGVLTSESTESFVTVERNGARDSLYVSGSGRVYRDY